MKKILLFMIMALVMISCGKQGVPKNFEGIYKSKGDHRSGTLIIKKIGKNKYNVKCELIFYNELNDKFNQDVEVLSVVSNREKNPDDFTFKVKELGKGSGVESISFPDHTKYLKHVQIDSFYLSKNFSSKEYELFITVHDLKIEGSTILFKGYKSYEY